MVAFMKVGAWVRSRNSTSAWSPDTYLKDDGSMGPGFVRAIFIVKGPRVGLSSR
jgi:hypothetical protein